MFPSFPYGKHCFQCQFLFSRCKLCLQQTTGNFNENPSMRALAKILQARASEHSSNFQLQAIRAKAKFCEHFQIGWDHSIPLYLLGLPSNTNPKFFRRNVDGKHLMRFKNEHFVFEFLRRSVDGKHLMRFQFQNEHFVFKFLRRSVDRKHLMRFV